MPRTRRAFLLPAATAVLVLTGGWGWTQEVSSFDVRFEDADGVARVTRVAGLRSLGHACTVEAPVEPSAAAVELTVTHQRTGSDGRALLYPTSDGARLVGVDGLMEHVGNCEAASELLEAMSEARPAPATRGAWVAFVLVGGGVLLVILMVAAAGLGIGPLPGVGEAEDG